MNNVANNSLHFAHTHWCSWVTKTKKKKKNLFCSIIQLLIKIYFVLFHVTSSRSAPHLLVSVISQEMSDLETQRKRMMLVTRKVTFHPSHGLKFTCNPLTLPSCWPLPPKAPQCILSHTLCGRSPHALCEFTAQRFRACFVKHLALSSPLSACAQFSLTSRGQCTPARKTLSASLQDWSHRGDLQPCETFASLG